MTLHTHKFNQRERDANLEQFTLLQQLKVTASRKRYAVEVANMILSHAKQRHEEQITSWNVQACEALYTSTKHLLTLAQQYQTPLEYEGAVVRLVQDKLSHEWGTK